MTSLVLNNWTLAHSVTLSVYLLENDQHLDNSKKIIEDHWNENPLAFFMPPILKKLGGHIILGLSVCLSIMSCF